MVYWIFAQWSSILEPNACMYDAYTYDPWSWCMCVWCRYEWCIYPWSLTLMHVAVMRDFFVSDGPTNGQTNKPILGVGLQDISFRLDFWSCEGQRFTFTNAHVCCLLQTLIQFAFVQIIDDLSKSYPSLLKCLLQNQIMTMIIMVNFLVISNFLILAGEPT